MSDRRGKRAQSQRGTLEEADGGRRRRSEKEGGREWIRRDVGSVDKWSVCRRARSAPGPIRKSLRPLTRRRFLQFMLGAAQTGVGAQSRACKLHVPHRLACGLIVHTCGIIVIGAAIAVWVRIHRIEYAQPVDQMRPDSSSA